METAGSWAESLSVSKNVWALSVVVYKITELEEWKQ